MRLNARRVPPTSHPYWLCRGFYRKSGRRRSGSSLYVDLRRTVPAPGGPNSARPIGETTEAMITFNWLKTGASRCKGCGRVKCDRKYGAIQTMLNQPTTIARSSLPVTHRSWEWMHLYFSSIGLICVVSALCLIARRLRVSFLGKVAIGSVVRSERCQPGGTEGEFIAYVPTHALWVISGARINARLPPTSLGRCPKTGHWSKSDICLLPRRLRTSGRPSICGRRR